MTQTYDEPFGPLYERPVSAPCPHCPCCAAQLCERGRTSVVQCHGQRLADPTMAAVVASCPCSAETTRGTHAWRRAQIRAVKQATEQPLPMEAEYVLRALAGGESFLDPTDELRGLRARRYADGEEDAWRITLLGRRYLLALEEPRYSSAVYVNSVDVKTRTAQVVVLGWHMEREVTVLADYLAQATDLRLTDLSGRYLDAKVNLGAVHPDDLVLTRLQVPQPITDTYGTVRPLWIGKDGPR
ncbi:hypothetical protein [Streptomyces sp. AGS-58]|uniref:hypothetical protein n=1 Tax=unclassified Streptomyces TaxID=2593676 RepID=UPI0035A2FA95